MTVKDEKQAIALNLAPVCPSSRGFSTIPTPKLLRAPQFTEGTSIRSPHKPRPMPFSAPQVADIGLSYINYSNRELVRVLLTPRSPPMSAPTMLGTTFQEEETLRIKESATEKE